MDLTTNGVVVTDAIKFIQNSKEKLIAKEEKEKQSKATDKEELEEEQGEEAGEEIDQTVNQVF
jgi:hypothetical protein